MSSRGDAAERHVPVLRDRIVDLLEPALTEPGSVCVDGTLGMGGHAEAILDRCPAARVIGLDRDEEALQLAVAEAGRLGQDQVGTGHELLGLAQVTEGLAAKVLEHLGTDLAALVEELRERAAATRGPAGS